MTKYSLFGENVIVLFKPLTLSGLSKKNTEYNLPRECIRRYFPSRKCFVFPPPASPENMRRLESLRLEDLVGDFREAAGRFCEYTFLKSPVKTLKGGHRVTGKCEYFIPCIWTLTVMWSLESRNSFFLL